MCEVESLLRSAADAAGAYSRALIVSTEDDAAELLALLIRLEETQDRLAGARLHLLAEAQLGGADRAVDHIRTSTAQARTELRLARDLTDRFQLLAEALDGIPLMVELARDEGAGDGRNQLQQSLESSPCLRPGWFRPSRSSSVAPGAQPSNAYAR